VFKDNILSNISCFLNRLKNFINSIKMSLVFFAELIFIL